jgi:heptosyltransferase-1
VVATNLELVRAVGGTPPEQLQHPDGRWLLEKVRDTLPTGSWKAPYAVFLPAAGHPSKILPVSTLARVAKGLNEHGMEVVVAWGPAERERAHAVASVAGRSTHLAPATDLAELTALLGAASVVVGGDTGPVHLAASLGVPTAATFLTTNWKRNGPLGEHTTVVSGTADEDPKPTGSARARPVRSISHEEILEAAQSMIEGVTA